MGIKLNFNIDLDLQVSELATLIASVPQNMLRGFAMQARTAAARIEADVAAELAAPAAVVEVAAYPGKVPVAKPAAAAPDLAAPAPEAPARRSRKPKAPEAQEAPPVAEEAAAPAVEEEPVVSTDPAWMQEEPAAEDVSPEPDTEEAPAEAPVAEVVPIKSKRGKAGGAGALLARVMPDGEVPPQLSDPKVKLKKLLTILTEDFGFDIGNEEDLITVCEQLKPHVPCLSRMDDIADRVKSSLELMAG
jgi:hypothetical protein